MRGRDFLFVLFHFSTMALGVFLPFLAESLRWVPRITMLTLLFVGFLSIDGKEVWNSLRHFPGAVFMLVVLKLGVLPLVCWHVFSWILPEYALGAVLVGGAATAVAAPFFGFFVRADAVLVLVALVVSSLLLPFTLPAVLTFLDAQGGANLNLPASSMVLALAVMTAVPFALAQILRRYGKTVTEHILRRRMPLFMVCMGSSNVAVFTQYSTVILQSPDQVLVATGAACILAGLLFALTTLLTLRFPPAKQLAFVVSCVSINNVLMLIISVDFFSISEVLLAAMYAAPFYTALVFYRLLGRLRGHVDT